VGMLMLETCRGL